VTTPLLLRRAILLLDLGHRVRELVEVSAEGSEESHNRAPTDVALPDLKAGDIGVARLGSGSQVRLRESSAGTQVSESAAEDDLIGSCHVG
jgi:hypothetical protein